MLSRRTSRRAAATPLVVLGLMLAAAVEVRAQGFDLGKLLQLPNSRELKRMGQQAQDGERCASLKDWVGNVPSAGLSRRPDDLLPLVEDGLFSRYFNKTYDQLTVDDFRQTQTALRECQRQGLFTPAQQQAVQSVWNQGTHANLSRQLLATRSQRSELASLSAELDQLQVNDADLRRVDAIRSRATSMSRSISSTELQAFERKVAETRERIAPPLLKQRVAQELGSANGGAGISSLAALDDEIARAPVGRQHTDPLRADIKAKIASMDVQVATSERGTSPLASNATGLAALEQGKSWLDDFSRRYEKALPLAPTLEELRRQVVAQRESQLPAAQPALMAQVRSAPSAQEAAAPLGRYLTAAELQSGVGRALKAASDERISSLERVAKNEAVFGAQAAQRQEVAQVAVAATQHPSMSRCDALAADPQDPTRLSAGVADENIDAPKAIAACTEALQNAPGDARMRFQQGRALLKANRAKEAVAAFAEAAKANQPGALAYLATAYEYGAGGLAKNKARSDELMAKSESLGYASDAPPARQATAAPGASGGPSGKLKGSYEVPSLVQAIYTADASLLNQGEMFTAKYLLSQAEVLMSECKSFRLSEFRGFQDSVMRSVMPKTQNEAVAMAGTNLMENLKLMMEAQRNPQVLVDVGQAEQRLEDAPAFAAEDMVEFTKNYGACGSKPLDKYTANLRAYFERLNARR